MAQVHRFRPCPVCSALLREENATCPQCAMNAARVASTAAPTIATHPRLHQGEERAQEHLLLCVAAFLVPLAGIVGGAYCTTRPEAAWRNTGRAMIIWAVTLVGGEPQDKKGADKGIDGRRLIYTDNKGTLAYILIQVKGGKVGVRDVRDFGHVIQTNNALAGILVSFERTKAMQDEADKLGFIQSKMPGPKRRKLQILTIKELLEEQKKPDIPDGWTPPKTRGAGTPPSPALDFIDAGDEAPDDETEE